jgi:hypothetical protein
MCVVASGLCWRCCRLCHVRRSLSLSGSGKKNRYNKGAVVVVVVVVDTVYLVEQQKHVVVTEQ